MFSSLDLSRIAQEAVVLSWTGKDIQRLINQALQSKAIAEVTKDKPKEAEPELVSTHHLLVEILKCRKR